MEKKEVVVLPSAHCNLAPGSRKTVGSRRGVEASREDGQGEQQKLVMVPGFALPPAFIVPEPNRHRYNPVEEREREQRNSKGGK